MLHSPAQVIFLQLKLKGMGAVSLTSRASKSDRAATPLS